MMTAAVFHPVTTDSGRPVREVDRDAAIAAVQALHERNGCPMPYGMSPSTTPIVFACHLRHLGLKLKSPFVV